MAAREATVQQRDPLAALAARPLTLVIAVATPAFAVLMAIVNRHDIEHVALVVLSLLVTTGTAILLAVASSPFRAPFRARTLIAVTALILLAHVLAAIGLGAENSYIRDDWTAMCAAVLLLAMGTYRPAREVATAGVVSTVVIAAVTVAQLPSFVLVLPPLAFVVVATAPVLALSLGAAVFSRSLNRGLDYWERNASRAVSDLDNGSEWIARSVQQDRVTILNRDVVPFLARVLEGEVVTEDDRETARSLSDSIRAVMVAEVDKSWLDAVVEQCRRSRRATGVVSGTWVLDEHRLAGFMTLDQRTALRALLVAAYAHPSVDPDSVVISIVPDGSGCRVLMRAETTSIESAPKTALVPLLAVLRNAFPDAHVDIALPSVTVRFSYEQW